MKRLVLVLFAAVPAMSLASCDDYGGRGALYVGGPYAYDGFYDDHYGAIYDGYWGRDGGFYYRNGERERSYHRDDGMHFNRNNPPNGNFHPIHGAMTPGRGVRTPHFDRGGHRGH